MAKRQLATSPLLINEEPLQVLPSLAVAIGLHEAMIVQQMHYWLKRRCHERDRRQWIYNRYEDWRAQFPFWSISTIKRAIHELEKIGVIVSANYNNSNIDKTKWYSINYDKLNELCVVSTGQDEPSTGQDEPSTGQDEPSTGQDEPSSGSRWSIDSMDARAFGQETTQETTDIKKEKPFVTDVTFPTLEPEVVPAEKRPRGKRHPPQKAERRCPPDYAPTPGVRQWAVEKYPEVAFEEALDAMRDWEFAKGKSDWDATLRTWIRTEAKRQGNGAYPRSTPQPETRLGKAGLATELAIERLAEKRRAHRAEFGPLLRQLHEGPENAE